VLVLRLHGPRDLRLHEEPVPEPAPGESLVRVTAVGLCGSDRHWFLDGGIGDIGIDSPVVPGHEFSGVVESGPDKGRLVAIDPAIPCERCEFCLSGASNLCLDICFAGQGSTDGALREYVAWPDRCLYPLSDSVTDAEGALVEPLAIGIYAADLARPLAGATVGVVGSGPIGLLLVALARSAGAAVIVATDPDARRLASAAALGASHTLLSSPDGAEWPAVLAATHGRGFDVVFEAAGEPDAVETAIQVVRPGGTVALVGIPSEDRTNFTASVARRKGLTIKISRRSTPDSFRRAAQLISDHALDLAPLITLKVPLHEAARGFEALVARSGNKVIVQPSAPRDAGDATRSLDGPTGRT
jgi:L-iditol 2-dehydrogenase